jgi:site-specific DNA-methyltransferase (adenine-specific)
MTKALYYGDNLDVLRESIRDESVDLIYLDPPFNSNATYNVLFRTPAGKASEAEIEAFEDSWHWGKVAAEAFDQVIRSPHSDAATMLRAMRSFLGENDMMAYLAMMAVRLIELHRVLKPTGSLYLHCDPTASHYLKILLDSIFGPRLFQNEIIWKRTTSHNDAKNKFPDILDHVFFYSKSDEKVFNRQYLSYSDKYLSTKYRYKDASGRIYRLDNLRSPHPRPNLTYTYKGCHPHPNGWAVSKEVMAELDAKGRLEFPKKPFGRIQLRRYLDERKGMPLTSIWDDIQPINAMAQERLGYPTQKPVALLERIIKASSNEGEVILDPFCGCGTAIHAAEKLGRQWIEIDVTHLAISLIERRLKDAFPTVSFEVHGTPRDLDGARDLAARDKYQFQWWAVSLVDAVPQGGKKKGMDRGIDGVRWVRTGPNSGDVERVIVSVKGGETVNSGMVRDLKGTVERERAAAGLFLTLAEPTREMHREAASSGFFDSGFGHHPKIQIMTIRELLAKMRPDLPPLGRSEGFRRAARERGPEPVQIGLNV